MKMSMLTVKGSQRHRVHVFYKLLLVNMLLHYSSDPPLPHAKTFRLSASLLS